MQETENVLWDLEHLREARGVTDWMFEQFDREVKGRVLEVGPGIGTFSERLLERPIEHLLAMEPSEPCVERLNREYGSNERVTVLAESLPGAPGLRSEDGTVDFILCQNVLEHIGDDQGALEDMAVVLKPGGRLHLLVPANPRLYGPLDESYAHFRRYTKAVVRERLMLAGLEIDDLYFFNALGIPGWWVQNRRGTDAEISSGSLKVYEALLKVWKPIEKRWRPPVGLSIIARARKPF
ncbi:MAG TPA: class I SAM-dependent methyltransferase [Solirubrobacterales bacterium]|nr:class I SAM-dependent methyltransferase [Solirubrobacterales bacterium]